jgi:hypothetical protein
MKQFFALDVGTGESLFAWTITADSETARLRFSLGKVSD